MVHGVAMVSAELGCGIHSLWHQQIKDNLSATDGERGLQAGSGQLIYIERDSEQKTT